MAFLFTFCWVGCKVLVFAKIVFNNNIKPKLLILDEPTRGVDVGAKAEVHHIINELAAEGIAIIMISSDLPEVLAMSDRVLVMREGRQMGVFTHEEATQEVVMTAAMGQNNTVAETPA